MQLDQQNIFLIGPMGAGKSTVGNQLAKRLGRRFYDTDQEIETRAGVDLSWIYSVEGEEGINQREHSIIAELTTLDNIVLSTGGGAVVRPENRRILNNRGTVIYLQTSNPEQCSRTAHNRRNRPLLQVDNLKSQIERLMTERQPLYEEIADIKICTDKKSVKYVVDQILQSFS
jgi:shikimate kinase